MRLLCRSSGSKSCAPNAEALVPIPGQRTGSHTPQLTVCMPQLSPAWHSEIKLFFFKFESLYLKNSQTHSLRQQYFILNTHTHTRGQIQWKCPVSFFTRKMFKLKSQEHHSYNHFIQTKTANLRKLTNSINFSQFYPSSHCVKVRIGLPLERTQQEDTKVTNHFTYSPDRKEPALDLNYQESSRMAFKNFLFLYL